MSEVVGNRLKRPKTGGRQKGTPNRVTLDIRQALAAFAEGNIHRLERWLDEVGKTDPAKAADLFLRLLEFSVPKLKAVAVEMHDSAQPTRHMPLAELLAIVAEYPANGEARGSSVQDSAKALP